ncbi:MAG: class I SAM-dependent methyltransferase [Telluria sp.]|nr:class I SAM-dependent methyltransferase [Telluria sp.]
MAQDSKRSDAMTPEEVQAGNRKWWTSNPMTYDWHGQLAAQPYSTAWFDAIDRQFLHGSRLFATKSQPFDRIMPLTELSGKRVLEVGCGMGFHTETMIRAGAHVTSVDLTVTAVEATTRRLELKGLAGRVIRADAEQLPFDADQFDFVWSWGVIHHSARTGRIVREIARVLRPGAGCRVMVYNRYGMPARVSLLKDHLLKGRFLNQSYEETLFQSTDGFSARYYVKEQFEDLFRTFFANATCEIMGQEADVLPLPRYLRSPLLSLLSNSYMERAQARRGGFLFLRAEGRE